MMMLLVRLPIIDAICYASSDLGVMIGSHKFMAELITVVNLAIFILQVFVLVAIVYFGGILHKGIFKKLKMQWRIRRRLEFG